MLPKLTPLQYLVLNLLFVGPHSGKRLRGELRAIGLRQSRAAFSRMMMRLLTDGYVAMKVFTRRTDRQTVRQCRYKVTDMGVAVWNDARKFYLNLAPPSDDLMPGKTAAGKLAAYDPELREATLRGRAAKSLQRSMLSVVKQMVKTQNFELPPR